MSSLVTSKADPPLLSGFIIAVIEVVQISDVALLHAHQAGQTLHVLICGFALFEKDTGQVHFQRGLHHFDRQRFELQRDVILSRRGAGELLHVDVGRCQHLSTPLCLIFNDESPVFVLKFLCGGLLEERDGDV